MAKLAAGQYIESTMIETANVLEAIVYPSHGIERSPVRLPLGGGWVLAHSGGHGEPGDIAVGQEGDGSGHVARRGARERNYPSLFFNVLSSFSDLNIVENSSSSLLVACLENIPTMPEIATRP